VAITQERFKQLLRDEGLKFAAFDSGTAVLLPFGSCTVLADLIENGEAVLVAAGGVFNLSGCSNKAAGCEWIASRNYRMKLGRWGYDPRDGEVRLDYVHAIEDGDLTASQLSRLIRTIAGEARLRVGELARAANSSGSSEDSDDDEDGSGLFGGLEGLEGMMRRLGGLPGASNGDSGVSFSLEEMPETATEGEWVDLTIRALRVAASGSAVLAGSFDRARLSEWMDQLRQLRDRSMLEAEEPWLTATLRDGHGLTDEEEFVLLWVASRQVAGDNRMTTGELRHLVGREEASDAGLPRAAERLLDLGLLKPTDDDGMGPYCLSAMTLDRIGSFLGTPSSP